METTFGFPLQRRAFFLNKNRAFQKLTRFLNSWIKIDMWQSPAIFHQQISSSNV